MISLIKHLLVLILALFACFSGFCADAQISDVYIDCTPVASPYEQSGQWWVDIRCKSSIDATVTVKLEDFVAGGGCTNCTAMSPEECEQYKSDISQSLEVGLSFCNQLSARNSEIRQYSSSLSIYLNDLIVQGNQFVYISGEGLTGIPGSTTAEQSQWMLDTPQGSYIEPNNLLGNPASTYSKKGGVNAIYNYYNDSVLPNLHSALDELSKIQYQSLDDSDYIVNSIQSELNTLSSYVSSIPCTACPGSGGGSGVITNVVSGGCPCAEVLQNIKNLVQEIRDDLRIIRQKIEKWDERLDQLKGWADRIESMLKVCQDALAPIGTNFVYATQYRDIDGYEFENLRNLHEGLYDFHGDFDFSTFGKYTWFTRVEYLLADIAGLFVKTNSDLAVDEAIRRSDDVVAVLESYSQQSTNVFEAVSSDGFDDLVDALQDLFSEFSFLGGVNASVRGVKVISGSLSGFDIEYSQGVGIFEGSDEAQVIMDRVVSVVRTGCQLLYLLLFSGLFYVCFIFIVKRSVLLVGWLCQFYSSVFGS